MGKDSLIKSTSKKKASAGKQDDENKATKAKKASAPRRPAKAKGAEKQKAKATAPTGKAATKRKPAKKASAAPSKKSAQAKASRPAPPPKSAAKPQPPTIASLLRKRFSQSAAAARYQPPADPDRAQRYTAPPFDLRASAEENARIAALLLKKIDLTTPSPAAAPLPAAAETPAPVVAAPPAAPAAATAAPEPPAPPTERPAAPATPTPPPPTTGGTPAAAVENEPVDPSEKLIKYLAAGFAFLLVLVIGASVANNGRYYLRNADGAVEIWQGQFAPKGQKLLIALPGAQAPEAVADVYAREDVFPLIFNYYIDRADAVLDVPGSPDFDAVKGYLQTALAYATTQALRNDARGRLDRIDLLILLYKAQAAESRGTVDSLRNALDLLQAAAGYASEAQRPEIEQRQRAVAEALARLEAQQAEAAQVETDARQLEKAEETQN